MTKKGWMLSLSLLFLCGFSYGFFHWWKAPLYSSFSRGQKLANQLGCFGCHGPQGAKGIPNMGSDESVPAWDGGTLMMYAKNDEEIREWILDGMPKRMRDDPDERADQAKMLIHMPAYRDRLSERELNDLVVYFKAIAWAENIPDESARKGREVALGKGCFGCHGPEGRSPMSNSGSLKGYIPPWDSADFNELVKDDSELEEWILKGSCQRFENNRLAQFFLSRQKISMPAYEKHMTPEELTELKAYIHWLRKGE
ncbi:MAG: c-type cytochrome [Chlamydiae bacterium]|nr:c-type cytochrome [Chlamydiota bacterium]MBI3265533.1 c-type cytochrome [Chlamydiota bacterium]